MSISSEQKVTIKPVGDASLLLEFEQVIAPAINHQVTALVAMIKEQQIEGIIDMIPSFCALVINYDPRIIGYGALCERMEKLLQCEIKADASRAMVFEIPVCYEGEFAPDLAHVAANAKMTEAEVIALHTGSDYLIYMLGFMPGFPYLGGLDERIHTPRLENPRILIPAGSVGIGAAQTGIYPSDSPGGWQLIGRTPVKTYDNQREKPILFDAGDYIRFVAVSRHQYDEIAEQVSAGTYRCVTREIEV